VLKQSISRSIIKDIFDREFGEGEWWAADFVIQKESGWNAFSVNKSSGAIGLFQFYPAQKLLNKCNLSDIRCQGLAGANYIKNRYLKPSNSYNFWLLNNWY